MFERSENNNSSRACQENLLAFFGELSCNFCKTFEQFLDNFEALFGQLRDNFWRTIEQFLDNFWSSLENFRSVFGEL